MPPSLKLAHSNHANMMVAPARMNLRRAVSYTGISHEKVPLSATSSRFSFNHLLFSPPPSPGLPALLPRPRKSPKAVPRPSRVFRLIGWFAGLVFFIYLAKLVVRKSSQVAVASWAFQDRAQYEMIGQDELPDFPTPIAVTDRQGRPKWTVSIPPTHAFPLSPKEYADMCEKCHEVAAHVRELRGSTSPSQQAQLDYYYIDPDFVDVSDAEERGLLPGIDGKALAVTGTAQDGHLIGGDRNDLVEKETCKTSLTFVLESPDAGLGTTLMNLWTAYGLAQKENRAFFVDDSRWAYGEYTAIFKAPPVQACNPPPRHKMLPCPHNARHLLVSVATAKETFGQSFSAEFEQLDKIGPSQERPMYDLARVGYEALFRLNDEDQVYVQQRIGELKAKAQIPNPKKPGTIVGVHVRHGDVHPFDYQYSSAYLPLSLYAGKIQDVLDEYHGSSSSNGDESVAKKQSLTVLASDDPDVYQAEEFSLALRAQEKIRLASVSQPKKDPTDRSVMHKFIDERWGWEGGFFASMFWNVGRAPVHNPSANAAGTPATDTPPVPSPEMLRLRGLIGRAYVMDLAVLGHGTDVLVCTVSAMGCRLTAVMMGWEKSMVQGKWLNIDGDYQWTGVSV